jgi:hypothetical protein
MCQGAECLGIPSVGQSGHGRVQRSLGLHRQMPDHLPEHWRRTIERELRTNSSSEVIPAVSYRPIELDQQFGGFRS